MKLRRFGLFAVVSAVLLAVAGSGNPGRSWSAEMPAVGGAGGADPKANAKNLMADALTDDARTRARSLPPEVGTREAQVLLQAARRISNQNPEMLRLLASATMKSGGNNDLALDALKTLVRMDPENLVAQVDFLDILARDKPVEEQIRFYQGALAKPNFKNQVKSEIAVRIGRLLTKRGDAEEALKYYAQALQLNDVNVGALQELCSQMAKSNAPPADRMGMLIRLLLANPYEPEALIAGARLLEATNNHNTAANWLVSALEQIRAVGMQAPPELFLELSSELICAKRSKEAAMLLSDLQKGKTDTAPTLLPMLSGLLALSSPADSTLPPPATGPATDTQPADSDFLGQMRQRGAAFCKANPKDANLLAETIWVEMYFAPKPADDVPEKLAQLLKLTSPTDGNYQRMLGWYLLRQHKYDEAKAVLAPLMAKDPLAALGMARLAEVQKDAAAVKDALIQGWHTYPLGLTAALLCVEARQEGVILPETPVSKAVAEVAKTYPESLLGVHRQPRDLLLVQTKGLKSSYNVSEPIVLNVNILNATDHALYAGPGGAVPSSIALGGSLQGTSPAPLGIFAVENNPRIYRLERSATMTVPIRVDQGLVRDLLYVNPSRLFSIALLVLTNPRPEGNGIVPGLGGIRVTGGQFNRNGFPLGGTDGLLKLCTELRDMPVEKQMIISAVLQAIVYNIPEDRGPAASETPAAPATTTAPATENAATVPASQPAKAAPPVAVAPERASLAAARQQIILTLVQQLTSGEPLVQAWMLRYAPLKDIPVSVAEALDKLDQSPDPTVRMMWYTRQLLRAGNDADARTKMSPLLKQKAAADTDPLAKSWAEALAAEADLKPQAPPAGGK